MCGIAGLFDTRGHRDFSRDLVGRLNDVQAHRGPDESGVHLEPGVALAHRRLSVIDLSTGQQPLFNEDGSVAVVFNGEIYNFKQLVSELEALGHRFSTRSDTEVIVHAWESWGKACVKRFRGMFAFALWDRGRQVLFLARDRFGVKPLHYGLLDDGVLVFGSELKAVTAHPGFRRALDPLAVEEFFALGYVADPRCIYKNAFKLPPAHTLTLERGMARLPAPEPYWDIRFTLDSRLSARDAAAEFLHRFDEAVRLRMVADVPLGAFLSGGVDSSAVVASMAHAAAEPVRTCAIGFDDPRFDESGFAARVASRYRTDHRLEVVGGEGFDLVDTLAWLYDEPFGDSSAFPTYRVCQLARKHVTVALSGDGGDENVAGYRRYRMHLAEQRWRDALPLAIRKPVFGLLGRLYPKADWAPRMFRAKTTLQALALDPLEAYLHSVSFTGEATRKRLYSPGFRSELAGYSALEVFKAHARRIQTDDPLALIQYIDYKTWLAGDINTKVDRASMAHALEVREPLLDHELAEWLATLPTSMKIRGLQGKWLFKKANEARLPNDILYRPKMGFSVPLARWLRGPLAARARQAIDGERMDGAGFFDMGALRTLLDEHLGGLRDHSVPLWLTIMFDAFLRRTERPDMARPAAVAPAE
ncbi:MAG: amidotransferase 1, exosortase A system-associated [Candidatus Accumulibacter sp.]|jgi:asparagine synthase (glutamine-hydrolysing)|nr:amidotransferase 1, exosortase A system-associated [Accumulibacter sp.]